MSIKPPNSCVSWSFSVFPLYIHPATCDLRGLQLQLAGLHAFALREERSLHGFVGGTLPLGVQRLLELAVSRV